MKETKHIFSYTFWIWQNLIFAIVILNINVWTTRLKNTTQIAARFHPAKLPTPAIFLHTEVRSVQGLGLRTLPSSATAIPHLAPLGSHWFAQIRLFYGKRITNLCIKVTPTQVASNLPFNAKLFKCALGSTAVNKASGCYGIPGELFKTLKDDAIKVLHSIRQQIWKTQQWPQDCKRSSKFPRRVVLKNVLTIGQLHSPLILVRSCLRSCMLGFSIMWAKNFQMSKLDLEKE